MKKIDCAWTEKVISFSELPELERFVERNKGKNYRYYNSNKKAWIIDDPNAWYRKENTETPYFIHIRIPYGTCRIPNYAPVLEKDAFLIWMMEEFEPETDGHSEDYITGYLSCFHDIMMSAKKHMCEIDY